LAREGRGTRLTAITGGEFVRLCVRASIERDVASPIIGFAVKDRLGQALFGENTNDWVNSVPAAAGAELTATFEFDMPLLPSGHYAVAVAVADGRQEDHVPLDWMHGR
jgi:lipopolysaccharide transport system ATP-binding protein